MVTYMYYTYLLLLCRCLITPNVIFLLIRHYSTVVLYSLFPFMVGAFCVLFKESFPISRREDILLCFLLALLFDLSHLDLQSILKLVFCSFDAR